MKLSKRSLMEGVGKIIYTKSGEVAGRIVDIITGDVRSPGYVILGSDVFSGFGSKYFAVPLTPAFFKDDGEKLLLKLKKEALRKAEHTDFDHSFISKRKSKGRSVLELKGYHSPINSSSEKYYA